MAERHVVYMHLCSDSTTALTTTRLHLSQLRITRRLRFVPRSPTSGTTSRRLLPHFALHCLMPGMAHGSRSWKSPKRKCASRWTPTPSLPSPSLGKSYSSFQRTTSNSQVKVEKVAQGSAVLSSLQGPPLQSGATPPPVRLRWVNLVSGRSPKAWPKNLGERTFMFVATCYVFNCLVLTSCMVYRLRM